MNVIKYEIRLCRSCGLRYPLVENHPFGKRCPGCLGTTTIVATHQIDRRAASLPIETETRLVALLDNIRSAWNVGSIFRTADGLGVNKLHLCGITPTPKNESLAKTALGAEETVEWEYSRNALKTAKRLRAKGYSLIVLEQDDRATRLGNPSAFKGRANLLQPNQRDKLALIVGNEVTGVDPGLLDLCDQIIQIPMRGMKRSLNVEVAFGIAVYWLRQV